MAEPASTISLFSIILTIVASLFISATLYLAVRILGGDTTFLRAFGVTLGMQILNIILLTFLPFSILASFAILLIIQIIAYHIAFELSWLGAVGALIISIIIGIVLLIIFGLMFAVSLPILIPMISG